MLHTKRADRPTRYNKPDRQERVVAAKPQKEVQPVDRHVGARVRMRRLMLDMSQEALGDAIGLTFQQVQKYEKGTNRIGSSRLAQIANVLRVPVPFFFEGLSDHVVESGADALLTTGEGIRLARAFTSITDIQVKRHIVKLVESLAEPEH